MARSRTTWKKGQSGSPATQWKPGQSGYPLRTRTTWPKGNGPGRGGPAKGCGWGGPAKGTSADPPPPHSPRNSFAKGIANYASVRGTPQAMARTELRNRRRDMAAARVFDVLLDSTCNFEILAAAKDIQDRVDGKPIAPQEITGNDGAPLLDYRWLPPDVLELLNEGLDNAEALLGHSLIEQDSE